MEVGDRVTYDSRGENQTGTITHVEDRVVREYTVFWDQDKYERMTNDQRTKDTDHRHRNKP
jgi:hypothetical protein